MEKPIEASQVTETGVENNQENSPTVAVRVSELCQGLLDEKGSGKPAEAEAQMDSRYEGIFSDVADKHVTFAAVGNEVFPAVDGNGVVFPLHDPKFKDYLKAQHPEKKAIQDHYVGLLRAFTAPSESDTPDYAKKYPHGMAMREIGRIAQLDRRNPEYQSLLGKLRHGVYQNIDFLMDFGDEEKKEVAMKEALSDANDWYDVFINTVYGEDSSFFGFKDEILFEDDVAELILKAFNAKDARLRLEAKRKLLLAEETGRVKLKRGRGDHEMKRYTAMLNESGVYNAKGVDSQGSDGLYTFYLVSRHPEKGDRRCVEAFFAREKPENPGPDVKVKKMALRCSEVEMPDSEGKMVKTKVFYHQGDRRKTPFGMVLKGMIKDSKNPSQFMEDLNGKRHVFGNLKEMEAVRRHIKKCFWAKGCGIQEWDWEDSSLGREGRGRVGRPGQSGKLQFVKHTEEITYPPEYDGSGKRIERREQFNYEHQDFGAAMFADYMNRIGVMHSQYEVGRVIRGSLAELITPKALYGHDIADIQFIQDMQSIERTWGVEDAGIWAEKYILERRNGIVEKMGMGEAGKWETEFRERHHLKRVAVSDPELGMGCGI